MSRLAMLVACVLAAAMYWTIAIGGIAYLSLLFADCGLEPNVLAFMRCNEEKEAVLAVAFAIEVAVYTLTIWIAARRYLRRGL